ncbi:MAG: hypothetical protein L0H73_13105 [Nitrococcus sp.]|nr:hypothetical protein [Nitrococcus sp.]
MIKTQVQIPDHLYQQAKRIAKEYEMSFAEVVRRGLERIVLSYPRRPQQDQPWELPSLNLGVKIPLDQLKEESATDELLRGLGDNSP